MTPVQCRAARGLLRWSIVRLSGLTDVPTSAISKFEVGAKPLTGGRQDVIRAALEAAGVIFVAENDEGPGLSLRKERASG
ncbi:transcriptional regulator [Muricoccus radiodurans]|uniref:transcriptional regulator n=1 Tax=Muricoccus radiodurans TaxID=2231721 RepID=UPI003CF6956C